MTALDVSSPVAVVATGAMGQGIAQVALVAGRPVRLCDAVPGRAGEAVAAIGARLDGLVEKEGRGRAYDLLDDLHMRDPCGRYAPSPALYRHTYAPERREGTS